MGGEKAVQLIPPGLLGFFGIKSGGRNPSELGEQVSPTLDLWDWYTQAKLLDGIASLGSVPSVAVNATGIHVFSPNAIIVPEGEAWWVDNFTIRTGTLLAAEAIGVVPVMLRPRVGSQNQYLLVETASGTGAAGAGQVSATSAKRFWVPPGTELGVLVSTIATAASITISAYLRFARAPL